MTGTILTAVGKAKIASATPEAQLQITHVAVGDGNGSYPVLTENMVALANEVWRGTSSNPIRDAQATNTLMFESAIPPDIGGFTIREIGIFDADGDMIAIGHVDPAQVKPLPTTTTAVNMTVRMIIALANAEQTNLVLSVAPVVTHNGLADRDVVGAHPASAIGYGAGSVDDFLSKGVPVKFNQDYAESIGGYPLYAELILNSGEKVKSTVPNNMTDPNVDMTGWFNFEADTAKKLGRTVWVNDFGKVGNGEDATQAFRDAVAAAGVGGRVAFGDGDYLLTQPTSILNGQEVYGSGKTLLINGFDRAAFPRGTMAGLIQWGFSLDGLGAQTTIYSIGTLASPTTMLTNTLTLVAPPPASLKVGSVINLHYFCARVLSISGNTITLDRTCPYVRDAGSTVYAFNETNNAHIHDFDIDFNGTESNIRWGYGVLGQGGRSNKIENIKGQYIGSKMVQLSKDVDSTIRNLEGFIGTDNFGTGGHGYVLRLSSGTDNCSVENVFGTKVRHVTDVSGAHRNRFFNCKGVLTDGVAHLTHGSSSYDNRWLDCDSDYCSAAYHSWDGDILTQFIGGDVRGRLTNASVSHDPSVVLRGQVVTNPAGYNGASLELSGMEITFQAGQNSAWFRYSSELSSNILIKDSTLNFNDDCINNALVLSDGTGSVNITLEDCRLNVKKIGLLGTIGVNAKLTLKNCKLICNEAIVNSPLFGGSGHIEVIGGSYEFISQGFSFFGLNSTTSKLTLINDIIFKNASQIWRRYANGAQIELGNNLLINSTYALFPNTVVSSIGVANNITYPPGGTWAEGSRIEVTEFAAGGYPNYIYIAGVWKGYGAIQA